MSGPNSNLPNVPGVAVNLANGNIGGAPSTSDKVVGYVLTGAGNGDISLLQPVKVVSLADAVAQGLNATDEPEANQFVTDFYNDAPDGSVLYIMLAPNTTSMSDLCDKTNASGAKKLLDFAVANAGGQIRVLGVSRTPDSSYVPDTDEFIDSDVIEAAVNAQAMVTAYFAAHTPVRLILAARVADATNATVFAPNTQAKNGVAFAIGANNNIAVTGGGSKAGGGHTASYGVSMGTILAKVAFTTPERNIGCNQDGPLSISSWYIGGLPTTPPADGSDWYQQLNTLISAGYITCTTYPGTAGYYISDDPMATGNTDDYQSLANCRVIDKASIIAYQSFIKYLKLDVDLIAGGTLDPADAIDMQAKITNDLMLGLSGNISGKPSAVIDTTQVLSADAPFNVQIRVTPKGYLKDIEIDLGFSFN